MDNIKMKSAAERNLMTVVFTTFICCIALYLSVTFFNVLMALYLGLSIIGLICIYIMVDLLKTNDQGVFIVKNEEQAKSVAKLMVAADEYKNKFSAKLAMFIPLVMFSGFGYYLWTTMGLVFGPVVLSGLAVLFIFARVHLFNKINSMRNLGE